MSIEKQLWHEFSEEQKNIIRTHIKQAYAIGYEDCYKENNGQITLLSSPAKKPVDKILNGEVIKSYESIGEAAKDMGTYTEMIRRAYYYKKPYKGYKFKIHY